MALGYPRGAPADIGDDSGTLWAEKHEQYNKHVETGEMKCGGGCNAWTETSYGGIVPGGTPRIRNPGALTLLPPAVGPAGQNHSVCRGVGLDVDTVRFWRNRWLGLPAAMRDAPCPGTPARITPEQICQIMSLAGEAPSQSGRPISRWTQPVDQPVIGSTFWCGNCYSEGPSDRSRI